MCTTCITARRTRLPTHLPVRREWEQLFVEADTHEKLDDVNYFVIRRDHGASEMKRLIRDMAAVLPAENPRDARRVAEMMVTCPEESQGLHRRRARRPGNKCSICQRLLGVCTEVDKH